MDWQPSSSYRYALKRGMSGADVWALQINLADYSGLDLGQDGNFGPATEGAVQNAQRKLKLTADGIAGLMTQRALCLALSQDATKQFKLPDGLLTGIMANESGFALAAYSRHSSGDGFDLGAYQQAFPPRVASQAGYAKAYRVSLVAAETAKGVRTQKDVYRKAPKVSTDKYAWQLAILSHNWPVAAENLAYIGSIYKDSKQDNQSFQWIDAASGGSLHTPRQWADHYISKSCVYITNWPA